MLGVVNNVENDSNLWIERFDSETIEVSIDIEYESINTSGQRLMDQEERLDASILIGPGVAQLRPTFVGILRLQTDRDAFCRSSSRGIEYVCGDGAHRGGLRFRAKVSLAAIP